MNISLFSKPRGASLCLTIAACATLCVACTTTPDVPEDLLPAVVDDQPALAAVTHEQFFTIAEGVPFVVDYAQNVSGAPYTARWGAHGGPLVTTTSATGGKTQKVVQRYAIGVSPQAAMVTKAEIVYAKASNVPEMSFFGADGVVDLLSAPYAIGSYTTSGDAAPGELLVYDRDYASVVARSNVNGFYSGADVVVGSKTYIAYSGLSGLSNKASTTNENGLYLADLCSGKPGQEGCATRKVFSWSGFSGPVAVDALGNVFVAGSLVGGSSSDAVFAVANAELATATSSVTVAEVASGGTSSLAAAYSIETKRGFVFARSFDGAPGVPPAAYMQEYASTGGIQKVGSAIEPAILFKEKGEFRTFFADPTGGIWIAIVEGDSGKMFRLRQRKATD